MDTKISHTCITEKKQPRIHVKKRAYEKRVRESLEFHVCVRERERE